MSEQMLRYNEGKPRLALLPSAFVRCLGAFRKNQRLLLDVAKVLDYGSTKYEPNNWRKGGSWLKVLDSAFRHVAAYETGQQLDDESGLHHLAHVACNIAFLMEFQYQGVGADDRYHLSDTYYPTTDDYFSQLLAWKDGGDLFHLSSAAEKLAELYETLPVWRPVSISVEEIQAGPIIPETFYFPSRPGPFTPPQGISQ